MKQIRLSQKNTSSAQFKFQDSPDDSSKDEYNILQKIYNSYPKNKQNRSFQP